MANAVVTVLEADGSTQTDVTVLDVGRQSAAASKSVAQSTEDKAVYDAIAASLSVMDDWDESDRAKANIIVGQAGVAAGAGAVGATTQRMTLASDDPAVAILGASGDAASATTTIKAALRAIATALGTSALDLGQGTGGSRTLRVAIDSAQLDGNEYEPVAASATTQALGATGASGDYLREVLIIPATTSPGAVQIKDGSNSAITVFTGGATSVSNLVPFTISLGLTSTSGAWQITTGTNVSAIGIGNFT